MKKTITTQTHVCDKCGKQDDYVDTCLLCGIEVCHKCVEKHGVEYRHAVYFQGSGDGFYCHDCDKKLKLLGTNQLHNAYLKIKNLREEGLKYHNEFEARQKQAEAELNSILKFR